MITNIWRTLKEPIGSVHAKLKLRTKQNGQNWDIDAITSQKVDPHDQP